MPVMVRMRVNILAALCFLYFTASGQTDFSGSFFMSFKLPGDSRVEPPMSWNIGSPADSGKMAMEIHDDFLLKGVSKRVLFNVKDSTWTMLMEYNTVKQGARIHSAAMYRGRPEEKKIKVKKTNISREIEGYHCRKVIAESDKYISEIWVTNKIKFDLCRVYFLLSHCGMMSEFVRKGDWYNWQGSSGMILEVTSKEKTTGETYTMSISKIAPGKINKDFFNLVGFRISEIPEGQNCGAAMEVK